jgi:hypothetical protein
MVRTAGATGGTWGPTGGSGNLYPDRSGDLRSITRNSDFYSARQWHSTGM